MLRWRADLPLWSVLRGLRAIVVVFILIVVVVEVLIVAVRPIADVAMPRHGLGPRTITRGAKGSGMNSLHRMGALAQSKSLFSKGLRCNLACPVCKRQSARVVRRGGDVGLASEQRWGGAERHTHISRAPRETLGALERALPRHLLQLTPPPRWRREAARVRPGCCILPKPQGRCAEHRRTKLFSFFTFSPLADVLQRRQATECMHCAAPVPMRLSWTAGPSRR
jgi:hypothetical protein